MSIKCKLKCKPGTRHINTIVLQCCCIIRRRAQKTENQCIVSCAKINISIDNIFSCVYLYLTRPIINIDRMSRAVEVPQLATMIDEYRTHS